MLLTTLRNCFFVVAVGAVALPAVSHAQPADAPKDGENAGEGEAEGEGDAPEKPQVTPEQIAEVKKLAQEGVALYQEQKYEEALVKLEAAYAIIPDPGLLVLIGNSHSGLGNRQEALKAWKKFLEDAPEGAIRDQITKNVKDAEDAIAEEERIAKEKAEAARLKAEEEERKRKEKERIEREKLPLAADVMLQGGMDQRSSPTVRLLAGGMLRFGKLAPEAHLGFDGLFRASDTKGTSAQGFTLLDVGARYAFTDEKFVGPFIGVGGSFGLFVGEPNEVRLDDDPITCAGSANGVCTFEVDKYITGRFGIGYGFASSDKATVAVRLDGTLWWYSVDDEQTADNVPAGLVDKPQTALSVMLGLEFIRWR